MRLLVANWSSRIEGGAEAYLARVLPEVEGLGHEVALLCEQEGSAGRASILPSAASSFRSDVLGAAGAVTSAQRFQPDVLYCNGLLDTSLEARLLALAPSVASVHSYYGMCITGFKTVHLPRVEPCHRRFGPACLVAFYPRRCGGLNPVTMGRAYGQQMARLRLLGRYTGVIAHSRYMCAELARHGIRAEHVPYALAEDDGSPVAVAPRPSAPSRLVFVGRLDALKGGPLLFEALADAARRLDRRLSLEVMGDGPDRHAWERAAARHSEVATTFHGWTARADMDDRLRTADLLVVPSLWPEPFGMVGLEAARLGVPATAFAVGGITDWLRDGENGTLASGAPPEASGLADAIVRAIRDRARLNDLSRGARNAYETAAARDAAADLLCVLGEAGTQRQ